MESKAAWSGPWRVLQAARVPGWTRVAALALLTAGCSPALREAVTYSGAQHEPRATPAEVVSMATLPSGYEVFGQLEAACDAWSEGSPVEAQWLVDLDCTERRLRGALREKAAAVGGALLVRERCGSGQRPHSDDAARRTGGRLVCRARVARPDGSERAQRPLTGEPSAPPAVQLAAGPSEAASLDDPTGTAAWKIRVSYTGRNPAPMAPAAPVPASAVHEWPELPASHQAVGTVLTSCEGGCTLDAMRASVRVVAGRLGAGDVAGVRCVPRGEGWSCVGRVLAASAKGS